MVHTWLYTLQHGIRQSGRDRGVIDELLLLSPQACSPLLLSHEIAVNMTHGVCTWNHGKHCCPLWCTLDFCARSVVRWAIPHPAGRAGHGSLAKGYSNKAKAEETVWQAHCSANLWGEMVAGPTADVAANYVVAIPARELSLQLAHLQVFLPQQ